MTVEIELLPCRLAYENDDGCAHWAGHEVEDAENARAFIAGPVKDRADDEPANRSFTEELRALATTDMAVDNLEAFLTSSRPAKQECWEIGEAFAETLLSHDLRRRVLWPWHNARDRKTPRASLPGADLVGFVFDERGWALLIGEVKTSSDPNTPPNVMHGKKGLAWQLETNGLDREIQLTLLKWLRSRCMSPESNAAYKAAVTRLLETNEFLIVGVLLRDTSSNQRDVEGRARHLGSSLRAPQRVEVLAWYVPVPIVDWPDVMGGAS